MDLQEDEVRSNIRLILPTLAALLVGVESNFLISSRPHSRRDC
jgi:hypothetical protein